jgi:hypothetical protein
VLSYGIHLLIEETEGDGRQSQISVADLDLGRQAQCTKLLALGQCSHQGVHRVVLGRWASHASESQESEIVVCIPSLWDGCKSIVICYNDYLP